jgi:hypothetical protein
MKSTEEIENTKDVGDDGDDPRYPYTYAADVIRMKAGHTYGGTKISRSDASRIRQLISKVTGLNDFDVADQLASYYLDNQDAITDESILAYTKACERRVKK